MPSVAVLSSPESFLEEARQLLIEENTPLSEVQVPQVNEARQLLIKGDIPEAMINMITSEIQAHAQQAAIKIHELRKAKLDAEARVGCMELALHSLKAKNDGLTRGIETLRICMEQSIHILRAENEDLKIEGNDYLIHEKNGCLEKENGFLKRCREQSIHILRGKNGWIEAKKEALKKKNESLKWCMEKSVLTLTEKNEDLRKENKDLKESLRNERYFDRFFVAIIIGGTIIVVAALAELWQKCDMLG
jgi:hypothetical protein